MKNYKARLRYIKHQRYIERKVLKRRRKNNIKTKPNYQPTIYTSNVLNVLLEKGFAIDIPKTNEHVSLVVPEVFCFSKNPEESLFFLRKLYSLLINKNIKEIHFNHLYCKYMGVCASTIMDVIVLECIKWRNSIKEPINLSGTLVGRRVSYSKEVDTLVKSSGLLKHLNIYNAHFKDVETLDLINNVNSPDTTEKSIEYLNNSLKRHGFTLTKEGANYFSKFLGEIIDNCEEHGGQNVQWFTLGHYSYDDKNKFGKCKLCIVDFGETIYESLKYNSTKVMQRRLKKHSKKTWLSQKSIANEETLYTVFSLQQRVSRVVERDVIRGNGTVDYIEAFLNLFNSSDTEHKSVFSITSGRTSILFDGKYKTTVKEYNKGYKNKVITFNDSNNLYDAPDPNYVKTIKHSFPGTIISMDLCIDNKYLMRSN